jgi:F-type H+-transporting ATPase subunit b
VQEQPTDHVSEGAAAAHGATEAEGHGGGGGLPQFNPAYWPGQIVWLLVIFVVLYVVLSKAILPKVSGTIEASDAKIGGDIAEARRLKEEAEAQAAAAAGELAEARGRSQRLAAEAKAKAQAEAAASQAVEDAKVNAMLATAEASIAAAREKAMGNVRGIGAETAQAIVEKLTGQAPEAAELEAALAASAA